MRGILESRVLHNIVLARLDCGVLDHIVGPLVGLPTRSIDVVWPQGIALKMGDHRLRVRSLPAESTCLSKPYSLSGA